MSIELAIKYAGGTERLRPHVKTHKMLEVAKLQVAAGIYKFKCATVAEAEMLGMAGAKDVLIAYPVQGPKVNRVLALIKKYPDTRFAVLIDNLTSTKNIAKAAEITNQEVYVFIDLNNGHGRTGIALPQVPGLVKKAMELEKVKIIGLHCYDGHIRMASLAERTAACQKAFRPVMELHAAINELLGREILLVAGGSPSFSVHARHHAAECSPGTWIFWDQRYGENYQEQEFQKAAVLATRVISKIDANTYCLDLGHKSVASESPFPRVAFVSPHQFAQVGHSEEHLILKSEKPDVLEPGEVLLAYPYHICPTVALYNKVQVVQNDVRIDEWEVTARARKITV
ncbi:MAG: D-TA family PLP-dependent enzyme [Bacteroidota bacterium]